MSSNFGTFSSSGNGRFPPQTIDEILSFVHDSNTLKSCSLVCRDWESTAQLYLFSVVHVGGHPPRPHNPYNVPHSLIPLHELHLFRHQGFVRELRILQVPNNAFLQLLQLVLDNGDFRRLKAVKLDQTSLAIAGRAMAQIPRLILSNVSFVGTDGLRTFDFSRFSSLGDLRFEGITFFSPPPNPQEPPANTSIPLQLKTLVIRSCTNDVYATLIDTLLSERSPVDIKHLTRFDNHDNQLIYVVGGSNFKVSCPNTLKKASKVIGRLLQENKGLQHIGLHAVHDQTGTHEWMALDKLTDSRVVKLAIFMEYPDDRFHLDPYCNGVRILRAHPLRVYIVKTPNPTCPGHTMSVQKREDALVVAFDTLQMLGLVLLLALLAPALFSRNVKRTATWFGMIVSVIIYCVSYSILMFIGGQDDSEPSPGVCLFQVCLVYSTPILPARILLDYLKFRLLWARLYCGALVVGAFLPWVSGENSVPNYSNYSEVLMHSGYHSRHTEGLPVEVRRETSSIPSLPMHLLVRLFLFSTCICLVVCNTCGISISIYSVIVPPEGVGLSVWYILLDVAPIGVIVTFGTQKDILCFYFRRKENIHVGQQRVRPSEEDVNRDTLLYEMENNPSIQNLYAIANPELRFDVWPKMEWDESLLPSADLLDDFRQGLTDDDMKGAVFVFTGLELV
ncbi:hypothetical protein F5146DRAFT_1002043 [Armillaria mellea]|nr:hypothetical protein F5146DRAFT_1002043 [Armillaria mellea]